jgi:DNA-binding HxlR family transcriptional regulator
LILLLRVGCFNRRKTKWIVHWLRLARVRFASLRRAVRHSRSRTLMARLQEEDMLVFIERVRT